MYPIAIVTSSRVAPPCCYAIFIADAIVHHCGGTKTGVADAPRLAERLADFRVGLAAAVDHLHAAIRL